MKRLIWLSLALLCVPAFAQDQGESALLLSSVTTGDLASFNFDGGLSTPAGLSTVGSPSITSSKSHSSPNSAHFPSGLNYFTGTFSASNTIYSRQYVYINTESATLPATFLRYYQGGSEEFIYFWDTSGHLSYYIQTTNTDVVAYTTPFPTGGWHRIETYTKFSATTGRVTIKVDGVQVYDSGGGTLNTGAVHPDTFWIGNIGNSPPTGWDTYQDNVDFDDSSWIGP